MKPIYKILVSTRLVKGFWVFTSIFALLLDVPLPHPCATAVSHVLTVSSCKSLCIFRPTVSFSVANHFISYETSKPVVPTKQRITDTVVAAADFSLEHLLSVTVFVTLFPMTLINLFWINATNNFFFETRLTRSFKIVPDLTTRSNKPRSSSLRAACELLKA